VLLFEKTKRHVRYKGHEEKIAAHLEMVMLLYHPPTLHVPHFQKIRETKEEKNYGEEHVVY